MNSDLRGLVLFGADYPLNRTIDSLPVDPESATIIAAYGTNPVRMDATVPYNVVDTRVQPAEALHVNQYPGDSDLVPYPLRGCAVEAASDAHCLALDKATGILYETWMYGKNPDGTPYMGPGQVAASACIWPALSRPERPYGFTSADAAGLSVMYGLVKYDEAVSAAGIQHAMRMTFNHTRTNNNGGVFVAPASHAAGDIWNPSSPPAGARLRIKASYPAYAGKSVVVANIIACGRKFGFFPADNGRTALFTATNDPRWDPADIAELASILHLSDCEFVEMGPLLDLSAVDPVAVPAVTSFSAQGTAQGTIVSFAATGHTYAYLKDVGPFISGSMALASLPPETMLTLVVGNKNGQVTRTMTTP